MREVMDTVQHIRLLRSGTQPRRVEPKRHSVTESQVAERDPLHHLCHEASRFWFPWLRRLRKQWIFLLCVASGDVWGSQTPNSPPVQIQTVPKFYLREVISLAALSDQRDESIEATN